MELLHDSGLVRSLDLVELNPFLDERGSMPTAWTSRIMLSTLTKGTTLSAAI
jgi:arginase family enzyme